MIQQEQLAAAVGVVGLVDTSSSSARGLAVTVAVPVVGKSIVLDSAPLQSTRPSHHQDETLQFIPRFPTALRHMTATCPQSLGRGFGRK